MLISFVHGRITGVGAAGGFQFQFQRRWNYEPLRSKQGIFFILSTLAAGPGRRLVLGKYLPKAC